MTAESFPKAQGPYQFENGRVMQLCCCRRIEENDLQETASSLSGSSRTRKGHTCDNFGL